MISICALTELSDVSGATTSHVADELVHRRARTG